jgi:hypothetical protein
LIQKRLKLLTTQLPDALLGVSAKPTMTISKIPSILNQTVREEDQIYALFSTIFACVTLTGKLVHHTVPSYSNGVDDTVNDDNPNENTIFHIDGSIYIRSPVNETIANV